MQPAERTHTVAHSLTLTHHHITAPSLKQKNDSTLKFCACVERHARVHMRTHQTHRREKRLWPLVWHAGPGTKRGRRTFLCDKRTKNITKLSNHAQCCCCCVLLQDTRQNDVDAKQWIALKRRERARANRQNAVKAPRVWWIARHVYEPRTRWPKMTASSHEQSQQRCVKYNVLWHTFVTIF